MEYADPKKVKEKLDSVGCGFCLAKWTQVTIHLGSGLTQLSCKSPYYSRRSKEKS